MLKIYREKRWFVMEWADGKLYILNLKALKAQMRSVFGMDSHQASKIAKYVDTNGWIELPLKQVA